MRPGRTSRVLLLGLVGWVMVVSLAGSVWSQEPATSSADTLGTTTESQNLSVIEKAIAEAEKPTLSPAAARAAAAASMGGGIFPFLISLTNTPKAGLKANVRQNTYYGQFDTVAKLTSGATVTNTIFYSWDEFRMQDTTIEKRSEDFLFKSGKMMSSILSVSGKWDWKEDKTINTAGRANLSRRDYKQGEISLQKLEFDSGDLHTRIRGSAGADAQKRINREQRDDFSRGTLDVGVQSGYKLLDGLVLSGRLYGQLSDGNQNLSDTAGNSSALGDSVGFGVFMDRGLGKGFVRISRANFEKKYLDYLRNSNGSTDTLGVSAEEWVVKELETRDAVSFDLRHRVSVGRLSLRTDMSRVVDDLVYNVSGVGRKERLRDTANWRLKYQAEVDSLVMKYRLLWKWEDQRFQAGTENRGRQYDKTRNASITWHHHLFRETLLTAAYEEELSQDIAQYEYNQNDKDRHQRGVRLKLDREWKDSFTTNMAFAYLQTADIATRETRSSNNNEKTSYEISPGYDWTLSKRLKVSQEYRIYIEYTNYVYSYLPVVTRKDNYNKRGNLNTAVTMYPTDRLDLTVRYDYNRRFNATKTGTDATGSTFYFKDQIQTVSRIDLDITFRASPWFTLQGATYSNKNSFETMGAAAMAEDNVGGQVWLGCIVDKQWGANDQIDLSARIKKFYAHGPGITETSADYWMVDTYLSWRF